MDADDDARTIGARLRQIRYRPDKSLRVVAGLAGMSKSHLSELERGESALDRQSEIVALANALQVAPSELTGMPVPRVHAMGDLHQRCAYREMGAALLHALGTQMYLHVVRAPDDLRLVGPGCFVMR